MSQPGFANSDDARQYAEAAMRRDRRNVRLLASVTIAVWVITALLLPALFLPAAAKFKTEVEHLVGPGAPTPTADAIVQAMLQMTKAGFVATAFMLIIGLTAEVVAAVLTVTLVLTVRRVTLRHVSGQLAEISRQLDELRRR
jgi:hypothetical protein